MNGGLNQGGPFLLSLHPWGKLGLGICMDLNYRDFVEFHIAQETDIVLFSTNWIDQGFLVQPYWFSRWEGFPGLVLTANRGGEEFGLGFSGYSAVFKNGALLGQLPHREEGILVLEIPSEAPVKRLYFH
jgi:predicted amidohydrolase